MTGRRKKKLKVKRIFEPDRLAQMNLKEAYERLVPANVRIVPGINCLRFFADANTVPDGNHCRHAHSTA